MTLNLKRHAAKAKVAKDGVYMWMYFVEYFLMILICWVLLLKFPVYFALKFGAILSIAVFVSSIFLACLTYLKNKDINKFEKLIYIMTISLNLLISPLLFFFHAEISGKYLFYTVIISSTLGLAIWLHFQILKKYILKKQKPIYKKK